MSKSKKTVITESSPRKSAPAPARGRTVAAKQDLMFGRQNYLWFAGGIVLIFIGLGLMTGGEMPSADDWDESIIYSFRRITLAPILIVVGLVMEIVAIFKK
jgi:sulfite exporter TauE/SafE